MQARVVLGEAQAKFSVEVFAVCLTPSRERRRLNWGRSGAGCTQSHNVQGATDTRGAHKMELGLKWHKGKINIQPHRIHIQAIRDGFRRASCGSATTILFDRLFYAQAVRTDCRLLTIDRALQQFGMRILNPK
jgi:hypothetical protein